MTPPRDEAELLARALAIAGMPLGTLAARAPSTRHKGWSGETIERALGVPDSNYDGPDFPALGIELKTIPVDPGMRPLESTHICTLNPHEDTASDWPRSRVRAKLARVLWIPLLVTARNDPASRIVGQALIWSPAPAEEARLRADWEELMERVACGRLEETSARIGEWLQLRPKAAHGRVTAAGHAADGTPEAQLPRGFYLRPTFTAHLLARHYLQASLHE